MGAIEEYGIILNFSDHPDVVGLIEHHQRKYFIFSFHDINNPTYIHANFFFSFSIFTVSGNAVEVGSSVKGLVLDLSDGVVNLSLKPELISSVRIVGTKKVMVVPLM